jgi:hypothetical protein
MGKKTCPDCVGNGRDTQLNTFGCCEVCGYNQEEAEMIDKAYDRFMAGGGTIREGIRRVLELHNLVPRPFYREGKSVKTEENA